MAPKVSKAIVLRHIPGRKGEVYYPIEKIFLPIPPLSANSVLVKISAVALNHRDFYVRQDLYPNVRFGVPLCCDGSGTVIAVGSAVSQKWLNRRVIINPGQGWDNHPGAPESECGYRTLGASPAGTGTLQEYMTVDEKDVFAMPEHLNDAEAAALPTAGLTAWRALMINSRNAIPGRNILITGVGGGVALMAMQFALAAGCNVFVTSGSSEKLRRAEEMGAHGGALYTDSNWDEKLLKLLPRERGRFDAIVDSAGGDIVDRGVRLLKNGGVIVTLGMTLGPSVKYPMKAVIRQIALVGTGMGSRKDLGDMLEFVHANRITPVVSRAISGIDDVEQIDAFIGEMGKGSQFGKLVVEIEKKEGLSKL
ncbi:hypothetical protein H2200_006576 [Cladophialophora chaetospira]|uniref:Enoyl reductase (ER) domain-containing protein n=1 Tax=Cladophialophora chaetospira TaxID=386627 RepID=A0AA39CHT7_9EURO|nr:hypothetical protein H2200_006576 [Cladophialophora chaetospira]